LRNVDLHCTPCLDLLRIFTNYHRTTAVRLSPVSLNSFRNVELSRISMPVNAVEPLNAGRNACYLHHAMLRSSCKSKQEMQNPHPSLDSVPDLSGPLNSSAARAFSGIFQPSLSLSHTLDPQILLFIMQGSPGTQICNSEDIAMARIAISTSRSELVSHQ
jgi:hypothetical protein